ncbi:hypothetical protein ACFQZC_32845 [Streptacidiphilus monticola]
MSSEPEPISTEARRAIEAELDGLKAERRAVAGTLGSTDATGDAADQADELQRATDVARLDSRIAELELRLRQAAEAGPRARTRSAWAARSPSATPTASSRRSPSASWRRAWTTPW